METIKKGLVYKQFNELKDLINGNLIEVRITNKTLVFIFDEDGIIEVRDIFVMQDILSFENIDDCFVTKDDSDHFIMYVDNFDELSSENQHAIIFSKIINYIKKNICQCPMNEVVISDMYVKCYLDKPGLMIKDLQQYENLFGQEGTLELHGARPYLLFVRENEGEE